MTTETGDVPERGGYPDLGRSIELLWGAGERPGRGPKPGLSVDRVVRAAIEIADTEGLAALSMRRVAESLGFTTMSLYRYVPGKAELVDLMLDTVVGKPSAARPAAADWRVELAQWARAHLAIFHRHPWALQVVVASPPMGPNNLAWFEAGLRALSATTLTEVEMIYAVLLVNNYVRGAAQVAVGPAQAEKYTGINTQEWGDVYGRFLEQVVDASRYPTLARLVSSGAFAAPDEQSEQASDEDFEFGLDRVLDGIEALVRSRAGHRPNGE